MIIIGDRIKDLEAGKQIGTQYALVLTGQGEDTLKDNPKLKQRQNRTKNKNKTKI